MKQFKNYTKTGLGISKTGKIQIPEVFGISSSTTVINAYNQIHAEKGEFVASAIPSGIISKGTLGIVEYRISTPHDTGITTIFCINGDHREDWSYGVFKLTEDQFKEAKYIIENKLSLEEILTNYTRQYYEVK